MGPNYFCTWPFVVNGCFFFSWEKWLLFFFSVAFPERHSHLKLILEQQFSPENIYLFFGGNLSVLGKIDASLKSKYIMLASSHTQPSSSKREIIVRGVRKSFWSCDFIYFWMSSGILLFLFKNLYLSWSYPRRAGEISPWESQNWLWLPQGSPAPESLLLNLRAWIVQSPFFQQH